MHTKGNADMWIFVSYKRKRGNEGGIARSNSQGIRWEKENSSYFGHIGEEEGEEENWEALRSGCFFWVSIYCIIFECTWTKFFSWWQQHSKITLETLFLVLLRDVWDIFWNIFPFFLWAGSFAFVRFRVNKVLVI